MKIICALGGGGSSFVLRALEGSSYKRIFGKFDTYRMKTRLEKHPVLIAPYNILLETIGCYSPRLKVLKRPDSFWTDWKYHESGTYEPDSETFPDDLRRQRDYLIETRHTRSAGLKISKSDISTDSMTALVKSYLEKLKMLEMESNSTIVLVAGHWAEYGILKDLNVEAIYLVRDPFNSLISHSKGIRHKKDYLRRGLDNINTKEWIDTYLTGPHHYWLNFAQSALEHDNAIIVRYNHFAEDWKKIEGLVDIGPKFVYSENDVAQILTRKSIEYIFEKTKDVCEKLGLGQICAKYRML